MAIKDVIVPDLGGAQDVSVIEILVARGDKIEKETSIITLESEKASMEVPAPFAGTIKSIQLKVGDKVNEGDIIMTVEPAEAEVTAAKKEEKPATKQPPVAEKTVEAQASKQDTVAAKSHTEEIKVPDLSGAKDVDVIEILVKPGDKITKEQSLITLESEKASMEVPSPKEGIVKSIKLKEGDKVNEGDLILLLETVEPVIKEKKLTAEPGEIAPKIAEEKPIVAAKAPEITPAISAPQKPLSDGVTVHAGPAVRRLAREFGVELKNVKGSGRKDRILTEDIQAYVKNILSGKTIGVGAVGLSLTPAPQIDFSKFGEIETKPLSKIKKLTGQNTHRSWVTVPHVTQFDEADITEMEAFRQQQKATAEKQGFKLTPLVFLMKAIVRCLQTFPSFNSSLDNSGENLIFKKYYNIGVAVDTPNGLMVPVIRNVDKKGLFELSKELKEISTKTREKGLSLNEMQGGCFTISSLGGIGGTAFTPIVNAPEVAILGVSKSEWKPVYQNKQFVPRLMLPLSLSYDHRVIDGAEAARFITYLGELLQDIRQLLL